MCGLNIDPDAGVMNGTRLQVVELRENYIGCKVLTGPGKDDKNIYYMAKMVHNHDDPDERGPTFRRLQFPVKVPFLRQ